MTARRRNLRLRDKIRNKEHLESRGRRLRATFPGRRVSAHRHTYLRKAPSSTRACRARLPCPSKSLRARRAFPSFASRRVRRRRGSSRRRISRHGPSVARRSGERKRRECEGTPRERLKRVARTTLGGICAAAARIEIFYISGFYLFIFFLVRPPFPRFRTSSLSTWRRVPIGEAIKLARRHSPGM